MGTVTIRFHNEQKARNFADKNNGKFMICHSKEASKYKVQVKKRKTNIESPSLKPQGTSGDEWSDYAWSANDY
jgi:hypothetical protein